MSVAISAVERDTGLSKDTLRVWERRYNFPQPSRDAFGERLYPSEQVDKLRAVKRLMDQGLRPGKIMHHSLDELLSLGRAQQAAAPSAQTVELANWMDLIQTHRIDELRRVMGQAILKHGLAHFVVEQVAPLNGMVGEAWLGGDLQVFEEHLYTEVLQGVLRNAIATVPHAAGAPRILLTTLPQEEHGLGLLMAEALLSLEGARCISLGVETPVADIVCAAASQQADVVALSFSAAYPAKQVLSGLEQLRLALPAATAIWAGGAAALLVRRAPENVTILGSLDSIRVALAGWRAHRLDA